MTESFFVALAGMIDTMMVSALGSYAVAAVGLTNQPKFIGLTIFFGMNVAVSALVARRKGEQRQDTANQILLTAMILACIACVAVSVLFVVFAPWMMELAGSNADTHEAAVTYFQIIMGGIFASYLALYHPNWPHFILIIAMFIAGALGGVQCALLCSLEGFSG